MDVFEKLNKNYGLYVVWKDTDSVGVFLDGNTELDILVRDGRQDRFESALYSSGFVKLKVRSVLRKENIEHYIKYQDGKYFHFHVYYKIRTGNHYVKEYFFDTKNIFLDRSNKVSGINVISEVDELALMLIRLSIKQSVFFKTIKLSELERMKLLVARVDVREVNVVLQLYSNIDLRRVERIFSREESKEVVFSNLRALKNCYSEYRTISVLDFYKNILLSRGYLMLLRASRRSNKTLSSKGVAFAVMGTDGSGKSAIVSSLQVLFSAKTSSKVFYLGGNTKTYSLTTRFYYYLYALLRVFSPIKNKYYFAWLLYNVGICSLEYGKAKDRVKLARKGNALKNKGWIVIYERFPVIGLFDFPNKLYLNEKESWLSRSGGKMIKVILSKIKKIIEEIEKPDISFLLTVDFETMLERRQMSSEEEIDIKKKLSVQREFLDSAERGLYVVNNNANMECAISLISNKVNDELCKFNS